MFWFCAQQSTKNKFRNTKAVMILPMSLQPPNLLFTQLESTVFSLDRCIHLDWNCQYFYVVINMGFALSGGMGARPRVSWVTPGTRWGVCDGAGCAQSWWLDSKTSVKESSALDVHRPFVQSRWRRHLGSHKIRHEIVLCLLWTHGETVPEI